MDADINQIIKSGETEIAKIRDAQERIVAENEAMREAIKEAQASLQWALSEINHVDISKPEYCDGVHAHADPSCPTCAKYQKANAALARLKPFLP